MASVRYMARAISVVRRRAGALAALLCFLLLAALLGMTILRAPLPYQAVEGRQRVTKFTDAEGHLTPKSVDTWLDDQFILRDHAVATLNWLQMTFRRSVREDVIVGPNGWLFLGPRHGKIVDNMLGRWQQDPENVRVVQENVRRLGKAAAALRKRGSKLVIVIAPSKESVYPQELPSWYYPPKGETVADTYTRLAKDYPDLQIIDLRPVLRTAAQAGEKVYYKYGTHWNHYGAYLGFQTIATTLPEYFVTPLPDYNSLALVPETLESTFAFNQISGIPLDSRMWEMLGVKLLQTFPGETDTLPANMGGSSYTIQRITDLVDMAIVNPSIKSPKILIFRDSFAEYIQPYFGRTIARTRFTWGQGINSLMINQEKPDLVIGLWIERALIYPIGISSDLLQN